MNEFMNIMSEFMNMMEETKSLLTFNVVCGIIAAIAVFIVEIVIAYKNAGKKPQNRKVEKAKRLGHVARGKLLRSWDEDPRRLDIKSFYNAVYVFQVDGKEYKCKYIGRDFPTTFMDVYYIHSPRQAFVECEYSYIRGYTAIFVYIIPIAVGIIVAKCLGGIL
jgi:hypothetical protein